MGEKPLTIPATIAVFAVIGAGITAILAWGGNISPPTREIGKTYFAISVSVLAICVFLHFWTTRKRRDIEADVLAHLFDSRVISQLGACHLVVHFSQQSSCLQAVVFAQNRYSVPAVLDLHVEPQPAHGVLESSIPRAHAELHPSALICLQLRAPLLPLRKPRRVKLKPDGKCRTMKRGELVRFARRPVLQAEIRPWLRILAALFGKFFFGGGTEWKVDLKPFELQGEPPRRSRMARYRTVVPRRWQRHNQGDSANP